MQIILLPACLGLLAVACGNSRKSAELDSPLSPDAGVAATDGNPHGDDAPHGHGGGPYIDNSLIPSPSAMHHGELRVRATTEQPVPDPGGIGAFRVPCGYSHMSYDDPIVFPNQPGMAHLHTFFGNTGVNAASTYDSLKTTGNSTCLGGSANRTGYWVPTMVDTRYGRPIAPTEALFYYKTGYRVPTGMTQPLPDGLRMITGSARRSQPLPQNKRYIYFSCNRPNARGGHDEILPRTQEIPTCLPGDFMMVSVMFPQCWDGVNLDSADHTSHMAHAAPQTGCPLTHPVILPEITLNIHFEILATDDTSKWRLASDAYDASMPGGYSMHSDWMDGWNPEIKRAWSDNCVKAGVDCHAHLLGDGRMLY